MKSARFLFLCLLVFIVGFARAADEEGEGASGYYIFSTADLVAAYKSAYLPVLSGDKRGVYVETGKGIKRIRYSSDCRLFPQSGIADQIVEISDTDYGFLNLRQSKIESSAMSDMMRAEVGTEIEILTKGGGMTTAPSSGLSAEDEIVVEGLEANQRHINSVVQESFENDSFNRGVLTDLIDVKFKLTPERDVKNAYCALIVRYFRIDARNSNKPVAGKFVRMKGLGDLDAGRPNNIKFRYPLPEGIVSEDDIELLLFSGDGKALATNQSKNLRPLTVAEFERFQALSAKAN